GREARAQDPAAAAGRDAHGALARLDARAGARQPAVHHAGDRRGVGRRDRAARGRMIFGLEGTLIAELLLLGCATRFLAGLLGVGMLLGALVSLDRSHRGVDGGLGVLLAVAASMATILCASRSSVRAHDKRGMVRWDIVRGVAPGIVIAGLVAGGGAFAMLKGV